MVLHILYIGRLLTLKSRWLCPVAFIFLPLATVLAGGPVEHRRRDVTDLAGVQCRVALEGVELEDVPRRETLKGNNIAT